MRPRTLLSYSALVSALVSIGIGQLFTKSHHPAQAAAIIQRYDQIRSTGIIRAAYVIGAPLFMIDPNTGEKSGVFYEIVTTAASRLGLEVNWTTEAGYGQMAQDLQDGKYDLAGSGVWINSDRAKSADFSMPLYYDAVFAYTRSSDAQAFSISSLNSSAITISTMDGELGAAIATLQFPKAKTLALPQNATFVQLILNVIAHKADVVFLSRSAAADYAAMHPGDIAPIEAQQPLRIFPNALMMAKGQYLLRDALNYVLSEMDNDGTIDRILGRYERTPQAFLRLAPPYRIGARE